jgi:electron transport complex protein RnfC
MKNHILEVLGLKRRAGVHPPSQKLTAEHAIERAPLPKTVTIPLQQHIGAPAKAIVKRGDAVKVGQVIAEAGGFVSAPIHATVSGTVKQLATVASPVTGQPVGGVIIESDGEDEWIDLTPADPERLSNEEILSRIKEAGIVGMGGATFPTHVKLSPPPEKSITSVIVNGAECEPYITADDRLMREETNRIITGLKIVMQVLSVKRAYIAIEENKPQAIERMQQAVEKASLPGEVTVVAVPAKYPMGAEKTLVKSILNLEVPEGGLPMDVGTVIQNVATLAAVADAITLGKPLVERVVTVTGLVGTPKNLLARFGTAASSLIEQCGGADPSADEVIFGGPMMGIAQSRTDTPIIKGTNCVLVKKSDIRKEQSCIRCGRCIETCPMGLMPLMFVNRVKKGYYESLSDYHIANCVECGACAYGCPANIPIVSYIKTGKAELRKLGVK